MDNFIIICCDIINDVEITVIIMWKDQLKNNKDKFVKNIQTVCVVGAGVSGIETAKLALRLGKRVLLTDVSEVKLDLPGVEIESGGHTKDFIQQADCVVISPGVVTDEFKDKFVKEDVAFVGTMEFASWFCKSENIIAITGTNGKTTTTHMCYEVLEKYSERKVFCGGNIGTPFSSFVQDVGVEDIVCLEVSSFQLETIETFHPKVALLLNLKPDHLDRYSNIEDYYSAKQRIFENSTENDLKLYPEEIPNSEFVKKAVAKYGVTPEQVDSYAQDFKGLEHRLEFVGEYNGIRFVNDSKSTNVDATIWALKNTKENVILLAGGKDKGIDYKEVLPYADNVKLVVVFGQAKELIEDAIEDGLKVESVEDIRQALDIAIKNACSGDTILLSPMCSSFDQFKNYKQRGDVFKESVRKLYP